MTHPETRQLREDENEYQRGLDAEDERQRAIELEISFIRVDIAAKNLHNEFVADHYADPTGDLADIIRQTCLLNRAQNGVLGAWVQAVVDDKIRQVAEIIVDRRLK